VERAPIGPSAEAPSRFASTTLRNGLRPARRFVVGAKIARISRKIGPLR
jgi:hypothetical protein